MRKISIFFAFFLLLLQGCLTDEEPSADEAFKQALLTQVNKYRQQGCKCGITTMPPVAPLVWNNLLEKAARRHANDMAAHNHFDHIGTDGSNSAKRISDTGYNWSAIGENIAFGYTTASELIEGWIKSADHCQNIMNADFAEMGVAEADTYWVQTLGKQK